MASLINTGEIHMPSFDVVSEVDLHEVTNAVDQANREVSTRFDFRGSNAKLEQTDDTVTLEAETDFQLKQMMDIFHNKLVKRGVSIQSLDKKNVVESNRRTTQQVIIKTGIESDLCKTIVKDLKAQKMKVQAQIQGEQVRVTGKKRDDLQTAIAFIKNQDYPLPLQFTNFRD